MVTGRLLTLTPMHRDTHTQGTLRVAAEGMTTTTLPYSSSWVLDRKSHLRSYDTARPGGHSCKEPQQCHTYMEPIKATSNQNAKPWTSPECSMWNLNGISILQGKGHGLAVEAQPDCKESRRGSWGDSSWP